VSGWTGAEPVCRDYPVWRGSHLAVAGCVAWLDVVRQQHRHREFTTSLCGALVGVTMLSL
jgi:hypothetical protein